MRLLIKQRIMTFRDAYDVYDENREKKYYVKGEMFSIGHKLHVYDNNRKEVGLVRQKFLTVTPSFHIYIHGEKVGHVQKKITLFHPKYTVDYKKWTVDGDLMEWNYTVKNGRRKIASVSKKLLHWGDTYVIDIENPHDELSVLMLAIAIDAANCEEEDVHVQK